MKVKTGREHSKLYHFLWIITWLLFFPFVILSYLQELLELIVNFVAVIRNKIVYGIMEILFESGGRK